MCVIVAQSAANEAAQVYAITQNKGDALAAAKHVLHSAGGGVGYNSGECDRSGQ
jgi:hypothetical protein